MCYWVGKFIYKEPPSVNSWETMMVAIIACFFSLSNFHGIIKLRILADMKQLYAMQVGKGVTQRSHHFL